LQQILRKTTSVDCAVIYTAIKIKERKMEKNSTFNIRFWGVRGSHPVPGEATTRYGGNTSCVEVQAGEHTLIFDAGTGIIGLGRSMAIQATQKKQPIKTALFFSHLHTTIHRASLSSHQPTFRMPS
jgi:hypothetical protein